MKLENFLKSTLLPGVFFVSLINSCIKESYLTVSSDTTTIAKIYQPDGQFGKDAIIKSITPDQNYSGSDYLSTFSWTNGGLFNHARTLIEFDLSDIVPQTKISSAKLSLFMISHDNLTGQTGDNAYGIFRITQPWSESSVTWNNQPEISKLHKVSVAKSIDPDQSYLNIDITLIVQDIIDYPNESYGIMLKLDEEIPYKSVIVASSEYSQNAKRPKLVIFY